MWFKAKIFRYHFSRKKPFSLLKNVIKININLYKTAIWPKALIVKWEPEDYAIVMIVGGSFLGQQNTLLNCLLCLSVQNYFYQFFFLKNFFLLL